MVSVYEYLANETHVLIGGTTGSGKSTTVDGILYQLTGYSSAYNEIYIVDLKRVSLIKWKKCKHVRKYARTLDEAYTVINRVSTIMDKWFKLAERSGKGYLNGSHIYLIIDECADLLQPSRNKEIRQKQNIILEKLCI